MQLTRTEVLRVVDAPVSGEMTREEASRWAATPLLGELPDPVIEEVLDLLVIMDGWQIDQDGQKAGYLYDFSDIIALRPTLLPDA